MFVSKWHMHRMGLIDFWYYVNEEFLFKDGHMLLRGSNGSGKSVTMQSFIPLLLDGNKSSERLDSFGTRSRKIENYLLEEDGERDDRIGYLYLEFKRADADIYKTIGMGLHARRNKPVDAWYFVIEDNRRINVDIQLMDHNLAITKQMLKNSIGTQLIDNQKEYMDRVNHALFGFPTRDDYKEAINLLMQLRSPKLSNSLKPTMINEILSNSLQPLSEDDLRPMSEALSNMDEIKDQLDALKLSYASANVIANVYEQYNYAVLDAKAAAYLQEEKQFLAIQKDIQQTKAALEKEKDTKEQSEIRLRNLQSQQRILEEEKGSLIQQDLLQLVDDVARHKQDLQIQKDALVKKEAQEETKDNQRIDAKNELTKSSDQQASYALAIHETFIEMEELQERMDFEEHEALKRDVLQNLEHEFDYTYTQKRIQEEQTALEAGLTCLTNIKNLQQQQQQYLNEREKHQMDLEKAEKSLRDFQQMFAQLQDEYKENFAKWNQHNEILRLNDAQMLQVIDYIQRFEFEDSYASIEALIQQVYFQHYKTYTQAQSEAAAQMTQIQTTIMELQKEIDTWSTMQEPKPELDTYMEESRNYLKQQNIAFVPFYKMLDFHEDVSEQTRNALEETLQRMGLLNTLFVHQDDKENVLMDGAGRADQFMFIEQAIADLRVYEIKEEDAFDIQKMLEHFHVSTKQMKLYKEHYEIGCLHGTISKQVEAKFIGEASRERYRFAKLKELDEQLQQQKKQQAICDERIQTLREQLQTLDTEYQSYPQKDDLAYAKQEIANCENLVSVIQKRIQEVQFFIQEIEAKIGKEKSELSRIAKKLGISAAAEVFQQRKEDFQAYDAYLRDVMGFHKQYISAYEFCLFHQRLVDSLTEDVDMIRSERKAIQQQIETLQRLLEQKEKQLADRGYEHVKQRLDEIQRELSQLPENISACNQTIGVCKQAIQQQMEQIGDKEKQLGQQMTQKQRYYEQYLDEVTLYYVVDEDEDIEDVEAVRMQIQHKYPQRKRKDVLTNELQTSFFSHRGVLQEYNLSMMTLFNEVEDAARLDINARYQGIRINFSQLVENLKADIDKQSILLEDSDRALIEDILVNTISKKIRVHIQNSRRWVDVMNRYMNAMNTSSGLKLNLQWKSHKAENEEEMNSEKLVELLEKDIKILKDSDVKKLSSHFRSKIATARKLAEQEDNHESFHQVMRKVMDYRTWFDFRILSEKTGEKKKELTNNAFYAFSGGEKAMAMYVPLFSAVAAKFEQANEDAPLLIALDEAFAGVDEKNINNMFDLIGKFKFDFIMNSQVLWGDYPSVKALAIHELFRPENARFVTVISYEWNGHSKKLVNRA